VSTANRQDRAWQPIVEEAKAGRPRDDVAALYRALESLGDSSFSVLEVGCGGGYNSEIINSRFPAPRYHGVDLSAAMIAIARERYPERSFSIGSAYDLSMADSSHDVVVDGVALIHMPGWEEALAEYSRVASGKVVLHGLTLSDTAPTTTFAKYAYGQPALELVFNREELLARCSAVALSLEAAYEGLDYDLTRYLGLETVSETWVLDVSSQ
jgi:ubiquinone/menaquinone biosynthesis C-methylase UbiE